MKRRYGIMEMCKFACLCDHSLHFIVFQKAIWLWVWTYETILVIYILISESVSTRDEKICSLSLSFLLKPELLFNLNSQYIHFCTLKKKLTGSLLCLNQLGCIYLPHRWPRQEASQIKFMWLIMHGFNSRLLRIKHTKSWASMDEYDIFSFSHIQFF